MGEQAEEAFDPRPGASEVLGDLGVGELVAAGLEVFFVGLDEDARAGARPRRLGGSRAGQVSGVVAQRSFTLDRPRSVGELLTLSARLWLRNLPVFFVLAAMVVAPAQLLVDGWWAGTLDEAGYPGGWAQLGSLVAELLVIPALVTAMHVFALVDLADGHRPSVRRSATSALRAAPQLFAIVLLYVLATTAGLVALIVPGIWVGVALYFGAQVHLLERRGIVASLGRSAEVVRGRWGRAFLVQLIISGIVLALTEVFALLTSALTEGPIVAACYIATSALVRSYTALAGTLLFFDLRARSQSTGVTG